MAAILNNETKKTTINTGAESQTPTTTTTTTTTIKTNPPKVVETESAKCECCGLTEECTPAYIARVRDRYQGRWICGLCSEAIKDEIKRSKRHISGEEAMNRHAKFRQQFNSSSPPRNPTEELIVAVKQLVLRSLDSPRAVRSSPNTPKGGSVCGSSSFVRSKSCFSTIDD